MATLCGTDLLQDAVANGDTRTLTFHHVHSGATATVTFKRNGRYDPAALKQLNVLMQDWRRKESTEMDPRLFDIVWEVYRDVDATQPIQVIGGYRSPATNAMLRSRSRGVAQTSLHMQGRAMDFYIPGVPLSKVREAGLRLQRGGVGFYPTSGSPFVHLDTGGIRHWPRMSRPELARVFPNGKTVHVPSDGKPMSGYATALAEVESRGSEPGGAGASFAGLSGGNDPRRKGASGGAPAKNIFASLFSKDTEDDDEAAPAAAAPTPVAAAQPVAPQPVAALAAPVPPANPSPGRSAPAGTEVALAGPVPSPMPRPAMPAAASAPAAMAPFEVASLGPVPLPQPNPLPRQAVVAAAAPPAPRALPPDVSVGDRADLAALAAAIPLPGTPEATNNRQIATALALAPEPQSGAGETGGLPEVIVRGTGGTGPALAYADAAGSVFTAPRAQPGRAPAPETGPAHAERASAERASAGPAPARSTASQARKPQPYSQAMVAEIRRLFSGPSVAGKVSMHLPELRRFAAFVAPPRRIVAARFSREGAGGLSTTQFSGEAVVSVPVVAMMTAAPLKKPL